MHIRRKLLTVGMTLFVAAATGHVMQNADAISERMRAAKAASHKVSDATEASSAVQEGGSAKLPTGTVLARPQTVPLQQKVAAAGVPNRSESDATNRQGSRITEVMSLSSFDPTRIEGVAAVSMEKTCADTIVTLGTLAPAMLRLTVSAPCYLDESLVVKHADLIFSDRIDARGNFLALIPAMNAQGSISVEIADKERLILSRTVTDLASVARTGLQWQGKTDIHLTAPENGSAGTLAVLGNPDAEIPMMAEIYTTPPDAQPDAIQIEAEVTQDTCGRLVEGERLGLLAGRDYSAQPFVIAMPTCDAVGDYVVMRLESPATRVSAANITR